ncbi:MAG: methyltransferase domain-containing protein [Spirochaetes bacterium]|nr:methyltransferase domain-containing protein [Spirochaetota bacterium]
MPDYYEIYDHYAIQYDELVEQEDYQNNLPAALLDLFDWKDRQILEAGIGTGRVTEKYIKEVKSVLGVDRAEHMLLKAKNNLSPYQDKLQLQACDNLNLKSISGKFDIFIEGWAFGHTICDHPDQISETTHHLVDQVKSLLNPQGKICIIETLSTNSKTPQPPIKELKEFYSILETELGFSKKVIATDYCFQNKLDAQRIMGFFFGKEMEESVKKLDHHIVPEWTGIWYKELS